MFEELDGVQEWSDSLTVKPKRGRPPLIPDYALVSVCESLLGFFEYYWADVCWDLRRAKSLPQLRTALRRVEGRRYGPLELFVREDIRTGTREQLVLLRSDLQKAEAQYRTILEEEPATKERFDKARRVLAQNPDDIRIQQLFGRHKASYEYASRRSETLRNRVETLRTEVDRREAHFAQSELLEFLQSKRYSFTPLNLCKAMAGVPKLTWRQSAARLAKLDISHPYEAEYEMFRIFQLALGEKLPKHSQVAINRLRIRLEKFKKAGHAIRVLRKNWYYLRIELEKAYSDEISKAAIPFRAYSRYHRRIMSPDAVDTLLAEEEALDRS